MNKRKMNRVIVWVLILVAGIVACGIVYAMSGKEQAETETPVWIPDDLPQDDDISKLTGVWRMIDGEMDIGAIFRHGTDVRHAEDGVFISFNGEDCVILHMENLTEYMHYHVGVSLLEIHYGTGGCGYYFSVSEDRLELNDGWKTAVFEIFDAHNCPEEPDTSELMEYAWFAEAESFIPIRKTGNQFGDMECVYLITRQEAEQYHTSAEGQYEVTIKYNVAANQWKMKDSELVSLRVNWNLEGTWAYRFYSDQDITARVQIAVSEDGQSLIVTGYTYKPLGNDEWELVDVSGCYPLEEAIACYQYGYTQSTEKLGPERVGFQFTASCGVQLWSPMYFTSISLYREAD